VITKWPFEGCNIMHSRLPIELKRSQVPFK
jgi:hypothetical protein